MIRRYTHPEMGHIWSDERRFDTWLRVETAAAEAMVEAGIIPASAAAYIKAHGTFDIGRIEEIEQTTQHALIAFTTAVAERAFRAPGRSSACCVMPGRPRGVAPSLPWWPARGAMTTATSKARVATWYHRSSWAPATASMPETTCWRTWRR